MDSAERIFGFRANLVVWIVALACLGGGCKGPSAGGPYLASVMVKARTLDDVQEATKVVFLNEEYSLKSSDGFELIFEKPGKGMTKAAYGSFADNEVWNRVKVWVRPMESGTFRVGCDAFIVRHYEDRVFEEEQKLIRMRSKPYAALLEEIQHHIP